jgi:hypothetical protein
MDTGIFTAETTTTTTTTTTINIQNNRMSAPQLYTYGHRNIHCRNNNTNNNHNKHSEQ